MTSSNYVHTDLDNIKTPYYTSISYPLEQTMYSTNKEKIKEALYRIVECVSSTFGPQGSLVGINESYSTKDGVTVVNNLESNDYYEKIALAMVREASQKTLKTVGDGTTTTAMLLGQFVKELPTEDVIDELIKYIKKSAIPAENIYKIALTASNNDEEIAKNIKYIYEELKNPEIVAKQAEEEKIILSKGIVLSESALHPMFLKNGSNTLNNVLVLTTSHKFTEFKQIYEVVKYAKQNNKDLLIFCKDMIGECLETTLKNFINGIINVSVVQIPFSEEKKNNILFLSNSHYISQIENISLEKLGYLEQVIVNQFNTTLINTKQDSQSVAIYEVAGVTELEMKEKFDRVEDAIFAVKSSLKMGVVPGGGKMFQGYIPFSLIEGDSLDSVYTLIECIKNAYSIAKNFHQTQYFLKK